MASNRGYIRQWRRLLSRLMLAQARRLAAPAIPPAGAADGSPIDEAEKQAGPGLRWNGKERTAFVTRAMEELDGACRGGGCAAALVGAAGRRPLAAGRAISGASC
jgi:hypothetical protein